MNTEKQPGSLGFDDALSDFDPNEWKPKKQAKPSEAVNTDLVRGAAEAEGFTSREPAKKTKKKPAPANEPEKIGQVNIRTKASTIEAFHALRLQQEPKWPLTYAFERALAALERELNGKGT